MESMNPSGTGKDRAAKSMLKQIIHHKNYKLGCNIVEGTSGSTGIALAALCNSYGLKLTVVLPDDQAVEKKNILESYGANVIIVPVCSISNDNHYVNKAKKLADELNGIFINQFENLSNYKVHYNETAREIWTQTNGLIDAFVMSSGTGGTIAGISRYLKERNKDIKIILADPTGSSLCNYVKYSVCYTPQQAERQIKKHRYDSIVEGVGLDRITNNFRLAIIDDSIHVSDQEIVDMAHWILREEGLFIGSSSALNIVATCYTARQLSQSTSNPHIVTIICDSGQRHLSRFWNKEFLKEYGLIWPDNNNIPKCLLDI